MAERDCIPSREDLIRRVESANRVAVPWILVQIVASAALAYAVDWQEAVGNPILSIVAALAATGPFIMEVLYAWAAPRKEIDDLKESTRYGEFDKHRLRNLVNDTLHRLGLPLPGPPVYITPDKTLNAGAMHLGLSGFFRSLNGVYLNRQVLHRLTPPEVRNIMGHELGHFYRYYLLSERFRIVTLVFGALCGLWLAQLVGLSNIFGYVALSIFGSTGWIISGRLAGRYGESIEYLCDDYGAQVSGVVASINGLLKLGADSELQATVLQQELLTPRHANLNARDVVESIGSAAPFGHTTPEDLQKAVEESLAERSKQRRRLSVGGFLEFAWQGDGREGAEEAMREIKAVRKIPRLDWESLLDRPGRIELGEDQIDELVDMLEDEPDRVLFRLPEEAGGGDHVHPPFRKRILYLWTNRAEIESDGGRRRFR